MSHQARAAPGGRLLAVLAHPGERVRFRDNYLELEPGEERTVVLTHPEVAPRPQDVCVRAR
jgi:hypothetical protein